MALQKRFSFDEPDFAMIDTLFSLAEAHLFMQLVELQDSRPRDLPKGKTYTDLYRWQHSPFAAAAATALRWLVPGSLSNFWASPGALGSGPVCI